MKKVHFSQQWVSRVTSDQESGIPMVGREMAGPPLDTDVLAILGNASETDAVREMIRRGWFTPLANKPRNIGVGTALMEFLFQQRTYEPSVSLASLFRRQARQRGLVELVTTLAWLRCVSEKSMEMDVPKFNKNNLSDTSISHIVRLSIDQQGPRKAINFLQKLGVRVIVESSLPTMRTDGASFILPGKGPVIGLTLRYDRLDSFWFTLLHEIAHLVLHLTTDSDEIFVDTIENEDQYGSETETEADAFAKDSFIPRDAWNRNAFRLRTTASILALSTKLKIDPSIVAGRLRYERKAYNEFSQLVGNGKVRELLLNE